MVDLQNEDAFKIRVQELLGDELPFVLVWLLLLLMMLMLMMLLMMMMMMMMMMMTMTTYDFWRSCKSASRVFFKGLDGGRSSGSSDGGPSKWKSQGWTVTLGFSENLKKTKIRDK